MNIPVFDAICRLMNRQTEFIGHMSELYATLSHPDIGETDALNWPPQKSALGHYVKQMLPALDSAGIRVEYHKGHNGRIIRLRDVR